LTFLVLFLIATFHTRYKMAQQQNFSRNYSNFTICDVILNSINCLKLVILHQPFRQTRPDRVRPGCRRVRCCLRRPEGHQRRRVGHREKAQVDPEWRTFHLQNWKGRLDSNLTFYLCSFNFTLVLGGCNDSRHKDWIVTFNVRDQFWYFVNNVIHNWKTRVFVCTNSLIYTFSIETLA